MTRLDIRHKDAFPNPANTKRLFLRAKTFFTKYPSSKKMRRADEKITNSFIQYQKNEGGFEILILGATLTKPIGKKEDSHYSTTHNSAYLGKGGQATAKIAMNEKGEFFAVRIEHVLKTRSAHEVEFSKVTGLTIGTMERDSNSAYHHSDSTHTTEYQVQKLGLSLGKFLVSDAGSRLSDLERFRIALRVTEKIQALHDLGIAHRDIKPNNIIIDEITHEITIIDFGMAEENVDDQPENINGTSEYMPHESDYLTYTKRQLDIHALIKTLCFPYDSRNIKTVESYGLSSPEHRNYCISHCVLYPQSFSAALPNLLYEANNQNTIVKPRLFASCQDLAIAMITARDRLMPIPIISKKLKTKFLESYLPLLDNVLNKKTTLFDFFLRELIEKCKSENAKDLNEISNIVDKINGFKKTHETEETEETIDNLTLAINALSDSQKGVFFDNYKNITDDSDFIERVLTATISAIAPKFSFHAFEKNEAICILNAVSAKTTVAEKNNYVIEQVIKRSTSKIANLDDKEISDAIANSLNTLSDPQKKEFARSMFFFKPTTAQIESFILKRLIRVIAPKFSFHILNQSDAAVFLNKINCLSTNTPEEKIKCGVSHIIERAINLAIPLPTNGWSENFTTEHTLIDKKIKILKDEIEALTDQQKMTLAKEFDSLNPLDTDFKKSVLVTLIKVIAPAFSHYPFDEGQAKRLLKTFNSKKSQTEKIKCIAKEIIRTNEAPQVKKGLTALFSKSPPEHPVNSIHAAAVFISTELAATNADYTLLQDLLKQLLKITTTEEALKCIQATRKDAKDPLAINGLNALENAIQKNERISIDNIITAMQIRPDAQNRELLP